MTLAIAHRGDPVRFRENTLPALRAAVLARTDLVAIDVRLTRDGYVVLVHDEALERLWGSPRPVPESTLADLAALGDGADRRIPTLMEALAEFTRPSFPPLVLDVPSVEVALAADNAVADHGMHDRVMYSGSPDALRTLRARRPHARLMLTWSRQEPPPPVLWQAVRPNFLHVYWPLVDRELVGAAHRNGCAVSAWTVNDTPEMARLIDMGADAILTGRIADLVALTDRR
ncbi:glycerophosphodiester phosphodiesterase [Actinorugispora endophytica]|uniref:Glycerophosphoryl diester phosphodiesterase n=1 Tax=Actinorugispora endophytica TaxID=1605990 RepID=A0A4R6UVZ0_9ACTN|nr:glycerophosphodiester phosphodiesterase [Actinorugispora endophytica]TDQ51520.1 glycerophosphoryl diester phosphodiesterase [Actinorugispora endophytica]